MHAYVRTAEIFGVRCSTYSKGAKNHNRWQEQRQLGLMRSVL